MEGSWSVLIYRQNAKMQTSSFVPCFSASAFRMLLKLPRISTINIVIVVIYFTDCSLQESQSCRINGKTEKSQTTTHKFVAAKHLPTGKKKIIHKELKEIGGENHENEVD